MKRAIRIVVVLCIAWLLCSCTSVQKDAPIAMLSESAQATVIAAINYAVQQKVVSVEDGKRAFDELFHRGVDWGAIVTTIGGILVAIAGSMFGVRIQRGVPTQRYGLSAALIKGLQQGLSK